MENGELVTLDLQMTLNRGAVVRPRERITFRVGDRHVFPGLSKSVAGMRRGGYRKTRVSAHLAYGVHAVLEKIPADAVLICERWVHDSRASVSVRNAAPARMPNKPSLDDFPLAWRFTSDEHANVPADTLKMIEPLAVDEAAAIAFEARRRCTVGSEEKQFVADEHASLALLALAIPDNTTVVVSWSHDTAVRTQWRVFREHWDDFCYAGSDDVSIWAPGSQWSLCYFHHEVFILRRA